MRHFDELARMEREGFEIIVDKTWEDCHPRDCFDDEDYVIEDICRKIDEGQMEWFVVRARVLAEGIELGTATVGGLLYEDSREVLRDGVAEDLIWEAEHEARTRLTELAKKFTMLMIKHSERAVS